MNYNLLSWLQECFRYGLKWKNHYVIFCSPVFTFFSPFFTLSGLPIRGVTFGAGASRGKREITSQADGDPASYRVDKPQDDELPFWQDRKTKAQKNSRLAQRPPFRYWTTRKPTTPTPTSATTSASIVRNFELPQNITFVLCFWIKTKSTNAQLISVIEKTREPPQYKWRRSHYYHYYPYFGNLKKRKKTILSTSAYFEEC